MDSSLALGLFTELIPTFLGILIQTLMMLHENDLYLMFLCKATTANPPTIPKVCSKAQSRKLSLCDITKATLTPLAGSLRMAKVGGYIIELVVFWRRRRRSRRRRLCFLLESYKTDLMSGFQSFFFVLNYKDLKVNLAINYLAFCHWTVGTLVECEWQMLIKYEIVIVS